MNTTGTRIKELRKESGLSQDQLGDKVGCTGQVISNIERGYTGTKSELIRNIAAFFHVPAGYLLGRTDVRWVADNYGAEAATISARLQARLAETGCDSAYLRQTTGLSQAECDAIISGSERPNLAQLAKLAKSLGTTIDYLTGNSGFPTAVLSEEEEDMILYYRAMSKPNKRVFMGLVEELRTKNNADI